jgi:hypothetical protein
MKLWKFYTALLIAPLLTIDQGFSQEMYSRTRLSANGVPELTASKHELPAAANSNWFASVTNHIHELENKFYPAKHPNHFRVANSSNRLAFHISPKGYSVQQVQEQYQQPGWKMHFDILGAYRKKSFWAPGAHCTAHTDKDMLRYSYNNVEVQYTNSTAGLRQNFIIEKKPSGKGRIKIRISINGSLQPVLENNRLVFKTTDSLQQTVLLYEDLKVWDNQYQPLPATMQLEGNILSLEVDDTGAQYPITIDPITKTPDWKTNTNGLLAGLGLTGPQILSSLYGYAVCGVGDVNNDGYGDVAVSAPALIGVLNGNSLASVGAVFVYYGTPTGLATTPAKTLQPNTAVAGALFGLSIDAGDVTGDGINDIVVGAPLDHLELSVFLGTIEGTVGKVYVFPGGTAAATNPTNFLTLQMNTSHVSGVSISANALFGFSVAVTEDLNNDGKQDVIVGTPAYVKTDLLLLSTTTGAAFVYLTDNDSDNFSDIVQLDPPTFNLLGILNVPLLSGISGLMYGFSVDGAGDFNGDGAPDVVVGAPAGVNISSLTNILNGQILGGTAYVYYGKTNMTGINSAIGTRLEAASTGLLSNAANFFGMKVKGLRGIDGKRNGNIVVGAPLGGLLSNALSLNVKTGNVHIFKQRASGFQGAMVHADQVLESPRPANVLQGLFSGTLQLSLLFGTALDNGYDMNNDGYPDLVVGEPLSSGVNLGLLQTNLVGGSTYVYYGNASGGFNNQPGFEVSATYGDEFLSVNATALFGFSVTAVQKITDPAKAALTAGKPAPLAISDGTARLVIGSPLSALDFSSSLINLNSTLGTTFDFAAGSNGLGKAYSFDPLATTLPVSIVSIKAVLKNTVVELSWDVREELNLDFYEVQKSADGSQFENIGMVFPWDNQQVSNSYRFNDKQPLPGMNFYRLRIVDKDGSVKYSNIVSARTGAPSNSNISIAPNPVKGNIRAIFSGLSKGSYRAELRNVAGQLHLMKNVNIQQIDQVEFFERGHAAPGIYWLTVYDKEGKKMGTSRVIIQ